MTPERMRAWQGIFRDALMTVLAAFMLIYETVFAGIPNPVIIGAGLTLLGIPAALRLDSLRRKDADD